VASFTLVHSPLVGPLTWSRVGDALRRRGHEVAVPSLVPAARRGSWSACVAAAVRGACTGAAPRVLVGHSGAGPLLPVIARRLSPAPTRLVFVDAALPPEHDRAPLVPEPFLDHLRALAVDGRLPKWSEWFGPDALVALVPDAALREAIVAELPELPLAYFDARVPMPVGWSKAEVTYVLLSHPYRDDAAAAAARGWTVVELLGTHLDIVTRPDEIVDALEASLAGSSGEHG
jgi:hypothetical protein